MKRIIIFLFFSISTFNINAQNSEIKYPKVGDRFEDHVFTDMLNSGQKTIDTKEYRGKWLVLDFWSRFCGSCILSMPKMDKLSKIFMGKAKIMMIGVYEDQTKQKIPERDVMQNLFMQRVKKYHFNLSSALVDSTVSEKYDIAGYPIIFVINPEGKIVAKAGALDSTTLADFISGKSPKYEKSYTKHDIIESSYKLSLPLLSTGGITNGGVDTAVIGRSILARWNDTMPIQLIRGFGFWPSNYGDLGKNWAQAIGYSLPQLFNLAYFGATSWGMGDSLYSKYSMMPILEVKDPSKFDYERVGVLKSESNAYAYSLKMPGDRANYQNARYMLLNDLHNFLGYQSSMETRKVEVLKLVVIDQTKVEKLKTKGKERAKQLIKVNKDKWTNFSPDSSQVSIKTENQMNWNHYNFPLKKLLVFTDDALSQENYGKGRIGRSTFIDATGITYNVDTEFDFDQANWDGWLDFFRKNGLDVVKGIMDMKCIVIRDEESAKFKKL